MFVEDWNSGLSGADYIVRHDKAEVWALTCPRNGECHRKRFGRRKRKCKLDGSDRNAILEVIEKDPKEQRVMRHLDGNKNLSEVVPQARRLLYPFLVQ